MEIRLNLGRPGGVVLVRAGKNKGSPRMVTQPRLTSDQEYTAFVSTASATLLQLAWLLTGDPGRAEELVQSVLVKIYPVWPRIHDGDPLAYARRMVVNARIDSWRRRRLESLTTSTPDCGRHDSGHDGVEDRDQLRRALKALTARERRIVILRFYLDLPAEQVALELGVSIGTVKSTASRALAKLRIRLAPTSPISMKGLP